MGGGEDEEIVANVVPCRGSTKKHKLKSWERVEKRRLCKEKAETDTPRDVRNHGEIQKIIEEVILLPDIEKYTEKREFGRWIAVISYLMQSTEPV